MALFIASVGVVDAIQSARVRAAATAIDSGIDANTAIERALRWDTGGVAAAALLRHAIAKILSTAQDTPTTAWPNAATAWRALRERLNRGEILDRARFFDLVARAHLLVTPSEPLPDTAFDAAFVRSGWFDAALAAQTIAPGRLDLLVPPLADAFTQGSIDVVSDNANRLIATNADDPVGAWFLGLAEIQSDETQQRGFMRMRDALDGGIGRFYPVSEDLETMIRQTADGNRP